MARSGKNKISDDDVTAIVSNMNLSRKEMWELVYEDFGEGRCFMYWCAIRLVKKEENIRAFLLSEAYLDGYIELAKIIWNSGDLYVAINFLLWVREYEEDLASIKANFDF